MPALVALVHVAELGPKNIEQLARTDLLSTLAWFSLHPLKAVRQPEDEVQIHLSLEVGPEVDRPAFEHGIHHLGQPRPQIS